MKKEKTALLITVCFLLLDGKNGEGHKDDLNLSNEDFQAPSTSDKLVELPQSRISQCICKKSIEKDYTMCRKTLTKKCISFPKDIQFSTGIFRITLTSIKVLKKEDFQKNTHIGTLHIEENLELEKIEPGIFMGMNKLINLSITSCKNLRYLERDTFKGLDNVNFIKLYENGFVNLKNFVPALSPVYVPNLTRLAISHYFFQHVEEDDFKDLKNTNITVLSFDFAHIEYIHPKSLNVFNKLVQLGIGKNFITPQNLYQLIEQLYLNNVPIEYIALNYLGFTKIPYKLLKIIGKTNVSHLGLSTNLFERIGKLPYMPNIKRLDMENVNALKIEDNAFDLIPNLSVLFMQKNQFSSIPPAILTPNIEYIDLSYSGKYFKLTEGIFENSSKLYYLNLSGNSIQVINDNMFAGLTGLNLLHMVGVSLISVGNSTFADLKSLRHLYLSENSYLSKILDKNFFYGLVSLERLYLDKCGIEILQKNLFDYIKNLQELSLSNNFIKKISPYVFRNLIHLNYLNVSSNLFTPWKHELLKNNLNLKTLLLQNNKINKITFEMVQDFHTIEELDLSDNPFDCNCEGMFFLEKIFTNKTFYHFINRFKHYRCIYPENYNYYTVYKFLNETHAASLCRVFFPKTVIILSFIVIFFLVCILKIIYHYKWQLKYWMFLIQINLNKSKQKPLGKLQNNYKYDAFISYCNEDFKFVLQMVHMLENREPFLKLCVYERDFQIGTVVTENVLENVAKSRKIMIVLSEAYIKSPWCRWEAQIAENQRLFFEDKYGKCVNDSLVVIKLNKVRSKNLSPILRYLLKTRVYLQWDSESDNKEATWHKLREALI